MVNRGDKTCSLKTQIKGSEDHKKISVKFLHQARGRGRSDKEVLGNFILFILLVVPEFGTRGLELARHALSPDFRKF